MKKLAALVLAALMAAAMTACGPKPPQVPDLTVMNDTASGADAAEEPVHAEPKEIESPVAGDDRFITLTLENELIISYPVTFSIDAKTDGMLLSVAQPEGNNIVVSCQEIMSTGLEEALGEETLRAQLEAQGSVLVKYQQVVCGNGYGAKLLARADGDNGDERNQMIFILINQTKTKAFYVILTTKENNFDAFQGTENYLLLK
ncbi:MAG: hypothetical protein FWE86_00620 [Oscillospiraceae bacterium]|nr:hypothetical protein [Oscillospiraceae bacterium]